MSKIVVDIPSTNIIICENEDKRQITIYDAKISNATNDNIMVFAVPSFNNGADLKLQAIDKEFVSFALRQARYVYHPFDTVQEKTRSGFGNVVDVFKQKKLPVFTTGAYETSICPSKDDLDKLDSKFKLSYGLIRYLRNTYNKNYAFVATKFVGKNIDLHPIAVIHPKPKENWYHIPILHYHAHNILEQMLFDLGLKTPPSFDELHHTVMVANCKTMLRVGVSGIGAYDASDCVYYKTDLAEKYKSIGLTVTPITSLVKFKLIGLSQNIDYKLYQL